MRRGNLGTRAPRVLVAVLTAAIILAGAAFASSNVPAYDDRPPLLADELAPPGTNPAGQLQNLELVTTDSNGRAELVIHADGALPYQVFELTGPDRLVFDLPGVRLASTVSNLEVADDQLVRIRIGQYREDPDLMARVVFDLTEPYQWSAVQEEGQLRVQLAPQNLSSLIAPVVSVEPLEETVTAIEPVVETVPATVEPIVETVSAIEPVVETVPATVEPIVETVSAIEPVVETEPATAEPIVETVSAIEPVVETEPATAEQFVKIESIETIAVNEPLPTLAEAPIVVAPAVIERPAPAQASTSLNRPPATEASVTASASDTDVDHSASSWTKPQETWNEPELAEAIEAAAGLQSEPAQAAPTAVTYLSDEGSRGIVALPTTEAKTIEDVRRAYTGRPITTNLVDADIKQVFSLFHEISGLNFVLDPGVKGTVTIVVDSVPWDQTLDLILKNNGLDMVLEGNVVRIAPVSKLSAEAQARKQLHEARELEAPPVTITRTLSYAKAEDVEKVIRDAIISPKGRVIVDKRTNTLIIRDIPTRVEMTDRLLTTLDAETPQVMIEARIVEVSRDYVQDLGIQWGTSAIAEPALGTGTSLDFPHRARVDYDLNLPRNPAASALGFSFGNVLDSFTLDITLDALETEGYARRLSSPKIATQNNEPAEIEQGVRIPVVSTTATEIDVRFVSASLRLKVTPQITAEGTVVLEVEVENNSPDFVNTVGEVPAINTQRAQTTVLIDDNGTTVIAGIFTVNEGRSESGVPFFRNIPGLGWLFRSRNVQTRNRELLIFITPRIIKAS